jgi:photosystem II stability/assembly factor-like uncharacterized protein
MKFIKFTLVTIIFFVSIKINAKPTEGIDTVPSYVYNELKFRSAGPAMTSGRISDFAVNPFNYSEYYVGVASGNIWKTVNAGTTFEPVFDKYGSYSIGCLAIDPKNPNVVWAGTGENNHQRSIGYGDGVYKTLDGGITWKNTGLKESFQIGMIAINPENTDIVYVAAEGSAWGLGGDRGLYKTTNGGKTWKKVLEISEYTGINNVLIHPDNPNVIYATSEQRARRSFTKIGGGPETAVYKSYDGGENWKKITKGLPAVFMGGMGIAISPANTNVMYLIIEAAVDDMNKDQGGVYRSTDQGESWVRMSDHTSSGQYYNEIYCDPQDVDKVYSVETNSHVTEDGGKTFKKMNYDFRHVDDHAMWIEPEDPNHFLIGGDGGIYETFDGGKSYNFKTNLPITQFYRVSVDNDYPFYNIYGGTQDNNTVGGPSRTLNSQGISNEDWYVTLGGDGFWSAIDPENPDLVYCEYQYGNLYRFDKKSGELQYIKPMPEGDELTFRWNWNAPMIMSPHSNKRLYIAANKVFRSDDQGNSWVRISGDLTAQIDRNSWPVMDHYWSIDAVAKDVSTSQYGTLVSIDESVVKEDLLYAGSDDGVIQVTEDQQNWFKIDAFPGVPKNTYVSDIKASMHDENIVYASFDNRKRNDLKPYLLKSTDKGRTWTSIISNIPQNHPIHTIEQDHVNPDLLFAGTEFTVFFSVNGGKSWNMLNNGLPTISVKDIAIQRRDNDLILGTFGRSFYVLDDYSALRELNNNILEQEAYLFPVRNAFMYQEKRARTEHFGNTFFTSKNPPFGALITYYLKKSAFTKRQIRHKKEAELFKNKQRIPQPSREELRNENIESEPFVVVTISDENNNVVRKIKAPAKKGINRVSWDLRYPEFERIKLDTELVKEEDKKYYNGFLCMPGSYTAKLELVHNMEVSDLNQSITFKTKTLDNRTLPVEDYKQMIDFQNEISLIAADYYKTIDFTKELALRIKYLEKAAYDNTSPDMELIKKVYEVKADLDKQIFRLQGTTPKASPEEVPPENPSIYLHLDNILNRVWLSTSAPTETEKKSLEFIKTNSPEIKTVLKSIEDKIELIENELDNLGVPYKPGVNNK